jgi:hypothetical protein
VELWQTWFFVILNLESAFSRKATFYWFITITAAMTVRDNDFLGGVSSLVRRLGLKDVSYQSILDFFHSSAVDLDKLCVLWAGLCISKFQTEKLNGRPILVADGNKNAKSGRKMPGVKLLHQDSENNNKAEFIMGHMCQAVGVLVFGVSSVFCCPIVIEIHEGLKFSNRDKRTLHDKLINMIFKLNLSVGWYLVADAYYANSSIIKQLPDGCHLVSRVKHNTIAYKEVVSLVQRRAGRPKKYGERVHLYSEFKTGNMAEISIPQRSGEPFEATYKVLDLLWKPVGKKVRFVLVHHLTKGKIILMGTDLNLSAEDMIKAYVLRFKIEVGFFQQIYTFGANSYRFWMASLDKIRKGDKDKHLHKKSEDYKRRVRQKIQAYNLYMQIGLIAQGLAQYLSCFKSDMVYQNFRTYFRTIRTDKSPSEKIAAKALQNTFWEYFTSKKICSAYAKFVWKKLNPAAMRHEMELAA